MRQREQEETMKRPELANGTTSNEVYDTTTERQVGMKSKRDEDYEGEDVWEEPPPTGKSRLYRPAIKSEFRRLIQKLIDVFGNM